MSGSLQISGTFFSSPGFLSARHNIGITPFLASSGKDSLTVCGMFHGENVMNVLPHRWAINLERRYKR